MKSKSNLNDLLLRIEKNWCNLGYEIDDLGDFNKRTLTFIQPVDQLKNRNGEKFPFELYSVIKSARKDFIDIHKITMPMNFENNEVTLLHITEAEKKDLLRSARVLKRFGWSWSRVADTLNISKSYLYNKLNFTQLEKSSKITIQKIDFDKKKSEPSENKKVMNIADKLPIEKKTLNYI